MELTAHLFWHAFGLFLPATGLGALLPVLARLVWRQEPGLRRWWPLAWRTTAAGCAVKVLGLVLTGHDGRMATYLAMALAAAAVVGWFGLLHPPAVAAEEGADPDPAAVSLPSPPA